MPNNIRKRRNNLWKEKEGKCYWCGIQTILPPKGKNHKRLPPHTATLDHLRTRLDPNRTEPNTTNEERTCLACLKCNHIRGVLDQKATEEIILKVPTTAFRLRENSDDSGV